MTDHDSKHSDHRHDHDSPRPAIERQTDVVIIGGSAAGLAAALQLGRQQRSVIVVDAGEPRNAPAAHMHGFLTRDGTPPGELVAEGRTEVRGYGVEVLDGRVLSVGRHGEAFRAELVGGHSIVARRVLVATGLVDELPDIDGVAEQWGHGVIHCPFCHGYEARDRRIVQIVTHPMGLHPATLFRQLSERLTIVLHGDIAVDAAALEALGAGGVTIVRGTVDRVVSAPSGEVTGLDLEGGEHLDADVVVVGPRFHVRAEMLAPLGLEPTSHPSGLGDVVATDSTGATAVAGVFAAGNVTDPSLQVLPAAANGSWVGAMISFDLADEDLRRAARPSANQADWDHRYGADALWSGNPNGTLVAEMAGVAPGRALDVGAGEGGDAVWLAEQGWAVTANDVSERALERVAAEADRRGLTVRCHHRDANALEAFEADVYDLVSAFYASIPRTPDGRAVGNLVGSVAPGGTLLVVSHDLEPMRTPIDLTVQSRVFDPDAFVRVEEIVDALAARTDWTVEVFEKRLRPAGAASSSHHVDDVVLRARRHR